MLERPIRVAAEPPALPAIRLGGSGARTEQQALRLLIASEEWRKRAAESLRPEWFESTAHRQLFEALVQVRDPGLASMPDTLSEPLRALWPQIATTDVPLDFTAQANLFAAASRRLEARPELRAWRQLNDRIGRATGPEKAALMAEKDRVARALQQRFPEEFRMYGFQSSRRAARRSAPDG